MTVMQLYSWGLEQFLTEKVFWCTIQAADVPNYRHQIVIRPSRRINQTYVNMYVVDEATYTAVHMFCNLDGDRYNIGGKYIEFNINDPESIDTSFLSVLQYIILHLPETVNQ